MRKIVCDICKIEARSDETTMRPWNGFAYITINPLTRQPEQKVFDLCADCSEDVFNFIKGKQNDTQRRQEDIGDNTDEESQRPIEGKGNIINFSPDS